MTKPILWADLTISGRRLYSIIIKLQKEFNKTQKVDSKIRLAQTIGILTEKMVNIAKLHTGLEDIMKTHKNESLKH